MSNILAGFVKGFADTTRGGLERREEEERELRKAKLLNELRMATEKEMTLFKESTPAAMEERDRARRNLEINEGRFGLEQDRFEVGKEQWEREFGANEQHRRRSLSLQERSLAARSSGKGEGDIDDFAVANELLYRYSKDLDELEGVDRSDARKAALQIVSESKTGEDAQRKFLEWMQLIKLAKDKPTNVIRR